eukprot:2299909-Ditylum_brightwellii.AAC.1
MPLDDCLWDENSLQKQHMSTRCARKLLKNTTAWLCDFQLQIDEVVRGSYFQITAEVWKPLEALEEPTICNEINKNDMLMDEWEW